MIVLLLLPALVLGQIELPSNISSTNVTTEDEESFQDQTLYQMFHYCNRTLLELLTDVYCTAAFHDRMAAIGTESWCDWEQVIRPYNDLTLCVEDVTPYTGCYFPNRAVQDIMVEAHARYFQDCAPEDDAPGPEPAGMVMVLTLLPIGLLPGLVYVVGWRSRIQD